MTERPDSPDQPPTPPEQEAASSPPSQPPAPAGSTPSPAGHPAGPGPYPPGQGAYPPVIQTSTNGFAVASLVLGIVWMYWLGSILALVFGYVAKGQIDNSGGTQSGRGMAIAGIVLGWVGIGVLVLIVLPILIIATAVAS